MKKYIQIALFYASNVAVAIPAFSQDTAEAKEEKPKVTLSGYIDSYILHAFNNPKSGTLMGNPQVNGGAPTGRAFDRLNDQFSLGLVQTKFSYSDKKSDLVIDLTFGPNAELGNFGNTRSTTLWTSPNNFQSQMIGTSAAIKQAYFTYKATDKLSFTAGQFGTHIGYEVIDAPINYNYSLSNLFNNGPFYHIGVKANYAFTDKVSAMVGLVNNVDALYDNNPSKGVIAQVFVSPKAGWNVYLNYIGSNETGVKEANSNKDSIGFYQMFDLTTGYQITDKFYLGLNAAYGFYSSANDTTTLAAIKSVSAKPCASTYSRGQCRGAISLGNETRGVGIIRCGMTLDLENRPTMKHLGV